MKLIQEFKKGEIKKNKRQYQDYGGRFIIEKILEKNIKKNSLYFLQFPYK